MWGGQKLITILTLRNFVLNRRKGFDLAVFSCEKSPSAITIKYRPNFVCPNQIKRLAISINLTKFNLMAKSCHRDLLRDGITLKIKKKTKTTLELESSMLPTDWRRILEKEISVVRESLFVHLNVRTHAYMWMCSFVWTRL